LLALAQPAVASGQELEPRAYSPAPAGSTFLVRAYSHSSGELLFDAAAPVTDARAKIETAVLGVSHVFDLAGHQASIAALAPYAWGDASGNVGEDRRSISRSGWGDARLKLSGILIGGPALSSQAFAARKPGPIVGASVLAVLPTGEYDPTRLINIGANRWAIKPEIGVSYPMGRWQADAYAGVWLFADNDNFFGGRRKSQDPLGSFQAHLSYTVRPRLWAAVDTTYYTGGATRLDGVGGSDRQNNVRVGATISLPVARRQSIQIHYSHGAITRIGGKFSTFAIAWQSAWFP
jgi:hypothetical protein